MKQRRAETSDFALSLRLEEASSDRPGGYVGQARRLLRQAESLSSNPEDLTGINRLLNQTNSETKPSRLRIAGKHLHRIERESRQIHPDEFDCLAQNVMRNRHNVAAAFVGLYDV